MTMFVVETDDDIYLGRVDIYEGSIRVRSGFRGHPRLIDVDDVVRIIPADEHPDVDFPRRRSWRA